MSRDGSGPTHSVWMSEGVVPLRRLDGSIVASPVMTSQTPTSPRQPSSPLAASWNRRTARMTRLRSDPASVLPNAEDLTWRQIAVILLTIFVGSTLVCAPFILLGGGGGGGRSDAIDSQR